MDDNRFRAEEALLPQKEQPECSQKQRVWGVSARALTMLNVGLTFFLIAAYGLLNLHSSTHELEPPYSPIREDGAVRYVNKAFGPEKIYQSAPSAEVEAAWDKLLGSTEGVIQLPKERANRLPETVESYNDPGHYIYGVSLFHQLHCLNRIRKTFYPDLFYPEESQAKLDHHKNHCIDVIRQAIMCHGDVSITYWWNKDYTYTDEADKKHYTEKYRSMNITALAEESTVFWDVKARCHEFDAIYAWTERHKINLVD